MKFFCLIAPLNHLELSKLGKGKGFLALAQIVLKNKKYVEFIKQLKEENYYIILDNGAAENQQVNFKQLIKAIDLIQPNEVVVPDVLLNCNETLLSVEKYAHQLKHKYPKIKLMAVAQGKDSTTYYNCYKLLLVNKYIDVIGISKIAVPKCFNKNVNYKIAIRETRNYLIEKLNELNLIEKPLHLLGAGDAEEYKSYNNIKNIRSTDSCFPILAATKNNYFGIDRFQRYKTPDNYFDIVLSVKQKRIAEKNINYFNKFIGGKKDGKTKNI